MNNGYFLLKVDDCQIITDGHEVWEVDKNMPIKGVLVNGGIPYLVLGEGNVLRIYDIEKREYLVVEKNVENMKVLNARYLMIERTDRHKMIWSIQCRHYLSPYKHFQYDEDADSEFLDHDLFVYFDETRKKRFILDSQGSIIYRCEDYIPILRNGYLILYSVNHDEINITRDFLGKRDVATVISKQGIVRARPLLYGDGIVVVTDDYLLYLSYDITLLGSRPYHPWKEIMDIKIDDNMVSIKYDETNIDKIALWPKEETSKNIKQDQILILKKELLDTK